MVCQRVARRTNATSLRTRRSVPRSSWPRLPARTGMYLSSCLTPQLDPQLVPHEDGQQDPVQQEPPSLASHEALAL